MKTTYIKPFIELLKAESSEIIAISIIEDGKADDSDALIKEGAWEDWEDDE